MTKKISWFRVFPEKMIISQLANEFPAFYGTRMFKTMDPDLRYRRLI
jgi:hypothetical protein